MTRYLPIRTRGGGVVQSGIDAGERGQGHPSAQMWGKWRGVVLNTYAADASDNFRKFQVECDVLLVSNHVLLRNVPVQQPLHGVNNAQPWVPKPSTRSIQSGIPLNLNPVSILGTVIGPVVSFDDLDGDMVLCEFLEGRMDLPIVVGALTHEASNRKVVAGEENDWRLHWQGTEVRVDDAGGFEVDTRLAYADKTTELPVTGQGDVTFRLRAGTEFVVEVNGQEYLKVSLTGADLGPAAVDFLVKGTGLSASWATTSAVLTAVPPAATLPTVITLAEACRTAILDMISALSSNLSTLHRVK